MRKLGVYLFGEEVKSLQNMIFSTEARQKESR